MTRAAVTATLEGQGGRRVPLKSRFMYLLRVLGQKAVQEVRGADRTGTWLPLQLALACV